MSRFSERIKELVIESGYSVYQISKGAGLGRTSIHRMMTGSLLPSREFLDKFYKYMKIMPKDCQELEELYMLEKDGIQKYENRMFIKEMIRNWVEFFRKERLSIGYLSDCLWNEETITSDDILGTAQLIGMVLNKELSENKETYIRMNLPNVSLKLLDYVLVIIKQCQANVFVKHLVLLNQNPNRINNHNYNLKSMFIAFKFCACLKEKYDARSYYSRIEEDDGMAFLWPYYIITNNYVVLVSNNGELAYLQKNKEIVEQYQLHFDQVFKNQSFFVRNLSNVDFDKRIFSEKTKLVTYKNIIPISHENELNIAANEILLQIKLDDDISIYTEEKAICNAFTDYMAWNNGV